MSLRNVPEQQLHGDAQLGHVLFEPVGRVLGRLPGALHQVLVSLRVVQLGGLDAALVVVKPEAREIINVFSLNPSNPYLAHSLLLACSGKVHLSTSLSAWLYRL